MVFYDFEVLKYDWLVVCMDTDTRTVHEIINDRERLARFWGEHAGRIWAGYNSRHYDEWILKALLAGLDPYEMSLHLIRDGLPGWTFSGLLRGYTIIGYDVMTAVPQRIGLKRCEGYMGMDIRESSVSFDTDRKLTEAEISEMLSYCRADVENTMRVFALTSNSFGAMLSIVRDFGLPAEAVGDSEARITARVLGCRKRAETAPEYGYTVLPCVSIHKYTEVLEWFRNAPGECRAEMLRDGRDPGDPDAFRKAFYARSLKVEAGGIPLTFGWGGVHGAPKGPVHARGGLYHVDVGSYYPSMLIAHGLVTDTATNGNYPYIYRKRMEYKKAGDKKAQLPLKKMLNALSGAMKDPHNPAYCPANNNTMCVNGQLMLLMLIEMLEDIKGISFINVNTDGLIVRIPDTDAAFRMLDDICYDWECRCSTPECSIRLATDQIDRIYQKDVNNYLWVDYDGNVERIGKYVKELSPLEYDLPIVNRALVDYMVKCTPVEDTIAKCTRLTDFQKVVGLSSKYEHVEHEENGRNVRYPWKVYRVFASTRPSDGRLLKCRTAGGVPRREKFADTPSKCYIDNTDITDSRCPPWLDRQWYVNLARKRLKDFGF